MAVSVTGPTAKLSGPVMPGRVDLGFDMLPDDQGKYPCVTICYCWGWPSLAYMCTKMA